MNWRRLLKGQPLTIAYSSVLLGTSLSNRRLEQKRLAQRLLQYSSHAVNLRTAPVVALAGSAAFIEPDLWAVDLLLTAVALAGFERRVGSRAVAAVFTAGHVGATLATQLPVMTAVERGVLPRRELRRVDVGSSFGVYACLGAYSGVADPRWRRWGLAALCLSLPITGAASGDPVAALGHPVALLIGMACWPWLRGREARSVP